MVERFWPRAEKKLPKVAVSSTDKLLASDTDIMLARATNSQPERLFKNLEKSSQFITSPNK